MSGNSAPFTDTSSPRLDAQAPDFTAQTTLGVRSLSDYRGKWLILFSHPADFTPVCTSEFIAFQNAASDFQKQNCELLGLSVDSIYSHLAWLESIEKSFGTKIEFPIIEDVSMAISFAYGMIHENSVSTSTVRSVFFIDPDGILRAITHYPMSVGRSVNEILRVMKALQVSAKTDLSLPEGWTPGNKAVLTAPSSREEAGNDSDAKTWYYREVDVPLEAVS